MILIFVFSVWFIQQGLSVADFLQINSKSMKKKYSIFSLATPKLTLSVCPTARLSVRFRKEVIFLAYIKDIKSIL